MCRFSFETFFTTPEIPSMCEQFAKMVLACLSFYYIFLFTLVVSVVESQGMCSFKLYSKLKTVKAT